jgi:hypothetical protein
MKKCTTRPGDAAAAAFEGWLLFVAISAHAVTTGPVSWTAEGIAVLRAIAARDPDPKIRCPDDLAARFVSDDFLSVFALRAGR